MITTRADLEALLGAVLWTKSTNPNLTPCLRAKLVELENRLLDDITHLDAHSIATLTHRAPHQVAA